MRACQRVNNGVKKNEYHTNKQIYNNQNLKR